MKITAISDLHGHFPQNLPGGDILILAGDLTLNDSDKSWSKFFNWLDKQDYKWKIYIAGNHDNYLTTGISHNEFDIDDPNIVFLSDRLIEIENIKIYASPWTSLFDGVNHRCTSFMIPENKLYEKFVHMPENLDILVTHSPPWGILDQCLTATPINCGSKALTKEVFEKKPKYHIFGHIHERGGITYKSEHTHFMNVSHCDESYRPRKEIRSFEI